MGADEQVSSLGARSHRRRAGSFAVAFVLPALIAVGCGAGGAAARSTADAGMPPGAPIGTAGIFAVDYGQFSGVYTFLDDGWFSGVHYVGNLAGHPRGQLSPGNSIDALDPISWANFIDGTAPVGFQEPVAMFGRTFTDSALSVKLAGNGGFVATYTTRQLTYAPSDPRTLYGSPLPMDIVAGSYIGYMRSVGPLYPVQTVATFTIDAGGAFASTVGDCTFTGTLSRHGDTGVFDAQATTAGAACGFRKPLAGIVSPLEVKSDKPELAVQLDSADQIETAVFDVRKS